MVSSGMVLSGYNGDDEMKKVYKYKLNLIETQVIKLPCKREILTVGTQESMPVLWALVDQDAMYEDVKIRMYGTGHNMPPDIHIQYISTIFYHDLVFHVFEDVSLRHIV